MDRMDGITNEQHITFIPIKQESEAKGGATGLLAVQVAGNPRIPLVTIQGTTAALDGKDG